MSEQMRAAVIASPREVRIETAPLPPPGPGEVRIRLEGCGVCHSNLPAWEGREWFRYPLAPGNPGHEGWGRVDAAARGVGSLREGDRVAFLSSSAYASHAIVAGRDCVKLPAALDAQPFPGEPIACAVNIFRRSDVSAGQSVESSGSASSARLSPGCARTPERA